MIPLGKIRVVPLADESLGVRSMSVYVQTPDLGILIDAGVSLAPRRYGLPPHPSEFIKLREARERILNYSRLSEVVIISHYHLDHYTPSFPSWYEWTREDTYEEIYGDKIVLMKDFSNNINYRQMVRAKYLYEAIKDKAYKILQVDGKTIRIGDTIVKFSKPFPHGPPGTRLGWVLMTTVIFDDEKVVHASDIQGPMDHNALEYIIEERPDILILGGPPLYLEGKKVSMADIERGMKNMIELIRRMNIVILSHHTLRDPGWKDRLNSAFIESGESENKVFTMAEYRGMDNMLLEARRKELWEKMPPNEEFIRWINLKGKDRIKVHPPL